MGEGARLHSAARHAARLPARVLQFSSPVEVARVLEYSRSSRLREAIASMSPGARKTHAGLRVRSLLTRKPAGGTNDRLSLSRIGAQRPGPCGRCRHARVRPPMHGSPSMACSWRTHTNALPPCRCTNASLAAVGRTSARSATPFTETTASMAPTSGAGTALTASPDVRHSHSTVPRCASTPTASASSPHDHSAATVEGRGGWAAASGAEWNRARGRQSAPSRTAQSVRPSPLCRAARTPVSLATTRAIRYPLRSAVGKLVVDSARASSSFLICCTGLRAGTSEG